ncbi:hypothetical protein FrEUN1fDRAFT_4627 [Parafrankia sp. EUN1f]|nr:hypothetical protein FrEUN1fDRAFT_4627 [Parafrankia sp. EUN1f]
MADVSIWFATQDAEIVVNLSAGQALLLAEAITRNVADAVSRPGQTGADSPCPTRQDDLGQARPVIL